MHINNDPDTPNKERRQINNNLFAKLPNEFCPIVAGCVKSMILIEGEYSV